MIERVSDLSVNVFQRKYLFSSQPVILTDLTKNWKASKVWNEDYFQKKFGDIKVGTMRLSNGKCDVDTYTETEAGKVPLAMVMASRTYGQEKISSVVASPLEFFPKSIKEDYSVPEYCADGKIFRSRIYIGNKGVVTPLHQDLPENLYVVVKGLKRITLFHPSDKKYLYPNSLFSRHPNFSQTDPDNPDYSKFSKLQYAKPLVVYLEAGETLFIPSLWWHHFRNEEDSIAMNFWWSQGWKAVIAWGTAKYKKLRN